MTFGEFYLRYIRLNAWIIILLIAIVVNYRNRRTWREFLGSYAVGAAHIPSSPFEDAYLNKLGKFAGNAFLLFWVQFKWMLAVLPFALMDEIWGPTG